MGVLSFYFACVCSSGLFSQIQLKNILSLRRRLLRHIQSMDVWRLASLRREYVLSRLRFSVLFFSVLVERDRDVRQVTVFFLCGPPRQIQCMDVWRVACLLGWLAY